MWYPVDVYGDGFMYCPGATNFICYGDPPACGGGTYALCCPIGYACNAIDEYCLKPVSAPWPNGTYWTGPASDCMSGCTNIYGDGCAPCPLGISTTTITLPNITSKGPSSSVYGDNDTQAPYTLPYPPAASDDVDYGEHPDSKTPYLSMRDSDRGDWGFVKGRIVDNNGGLWGIPVTLVKSGGFIIEKITKPSGEFKILAPDSGNITVYINNPTPLGAPYTKDTHFYDAMHETPAPLSQTLSTGNGNILDLGTITLNWRAQSALSGPTGTYTGTLTAGENNAVTLPDITVALRDDAGRVLASTQSTTGGVYRFIEIPVGSYTIAPVLERNWRSDPPQKRLALASGQTVTQNFAISGIGTRLSIRSQAPGTIVLVMLQGTTPAGAMPPVQRSYSSSQTYSTVTGDDALAAISVLPGFAYDMTCWTPDESTGGYTRSAAPVRVSPPAPLQTITVSCP
jgi:hypothetical protein